MLQEVIVSRAFVGHTSTDIAPPSADSLYQPVARHIFGATSDCHAQRTQTKFFRLIAHNIFSPSSLGVILRKTLYHFILSRFALALHYLLSLPIIILCLMLPFEGYHSISYVHPLIIHTSPMPSISNSNLSPFDFHFCLASDSITLPIALNAHVLTRADFDPDFVGTLLSRQPGHDIVDVILDTGCTFSITPDRRDFVSYVEGGFAGQVQTVNGPTAVAGTGIVRWTLISEDGAQMDLLIPCYHVPASTVCLLSPQDFCQSQGFDHSKDQFGGNSN